MLAVDKEIKKTGLSAYKYTINTHRETLEPWD